MKDIELKSRYGETHILKHIKDNVYSPICINTYIRIIGDNPIEAIDFDGGPFLSVGSKIKNKIIASINYDDTLTITLEDG